MSSFKNTEEVLKTINRDYISLKNNEVASNNQLLKATLEKMIAEMKKLNPLFKAIYKKPFYGGSYYDDLKVGKPDEFDLDLLLALPKRCETHKVPNCGCVQLIPSNKPGYFWFKIEKGFYEPFDGFIIDGYMQTNLVLDWLKGCCTKALNNFSSLDFIFETPKYFSESGPALTLRLFGDFGVMDIDLVPAFKFGSQYWPQESFRSNPSTKKEFFIVPKKAKMTCAERYWRASCQDQERELIEGKQRLKPALRLLKKMRNNLGHVSISSYALKTIVLWDLDTGYFDWNATLTDTFLKLLEKYKESLENKKIPYYWNKRGNLLDNIKHSDTLINHFNEISRKLKRFQMYYETNPLEIAKIILKEGTQEYQLFMKEYEIQNGVSNSFSTLSINEVNDSDRTSGTHTDQPSTSSANGWGTAATIVGIGAAVAIGLGILGTFLDNKDEKTIKQQERKKSDQ